MLNCARIIRNSMDEERKAGLAEGEKSSKSKIAKKLLNLGVDIDKISQATGLTEKEILALNQT